jgi:hypothetical protein
MDKWTPSGSAPFQAQPGLASLEPYKKYISSFKSRERGRRLGSASLDVAQLHSSDTGAPGHMAVTLDQVISDHQQDTAPSLEVSWKRSFSVGGQ